MNKELSPGNASPFHLRFNIAGFLILVVGMVIAISIYVMAVDDSGTALSNEVGDTKRYGYELERIGGKAAVLAVKFNQWFESLWHGRQLASTVALLSIVVALGCFLIAHVLADDLPRADKDDSSD